mgnify:CR=1 FL=1
MIDGKGTGAIPRTNNWVIMDFPRDIDPGTLNVIVVDNDSLSGSGELKFTDSRGFSLRGLCNQWLQRTLCRNRSAPCSPHIFCEQLDAMQVHADQTGVRLFTSGKDQPFVKDKYEETYKKFLKTQVWDVSGLNVGTEYLKKLPDVLAQFLNLQELGVASNQVDDDGATSIAEIVAHSTTITNIDLEYNEIGADGAAALAKALEVNKSITIKR